MNKNWRLTVFAMLLNATPLAVVFPYAPLVRAESNEEILSESSEDSEDSFFLTGEVSWESRYVAEGRDYLEGDPLLSVASSVDYHGIGFRTWYGSGYQSNYGELNLSPSFAYEIGNTAFSISYHHIFFIEENQDANEIALGLTQYGLPYDISVELDWYRSFTTEGHFSTLSINKEWSPLEGLYIYPGIEMGLHHDYVPEAHNGINHVSAFLVAEWELSDSVTLTGYVANNWAVDKQVYDSKPGDFFLRDYFWTGIGLRYEY